MVHDARPMEAMDSGSRLGRGDDGHRSDRGGPTLLTLVRDVRLPGNGVGRRRLLLGARARSCRTAPWCLSSSAVCSIAWGRCSTSCAARPLAGAFGPHELFHLFVLAGSLAHYLFILEVVVPFHGR